MNTQKNSVHKWFGDVGPRLQQILDKAISDSSFYLAYYSGDMQHEVQQAFGGQFAKNMKEHTSSCQRWDLIGIPCMHAVQAIFKREENPKAYISPWYKKGVQMKAYSGILCPIRMKRIGLNQRTSY